MRRTALAVAAVTLAGCSMLLPSPDVTQPSNLVPGPGEVLRFPQSPPAEPGRAYAIEIGTHCGVGGTPIDFDGAFWAVALNEKEPIGLDDPFDTGWISIDAPGFAVYRSDTGVEVRLRRLDGPRVFVLCR